MRALLALCIVALLAGCGNLCLQAEDGETICPESTGEICPESTGEIGVVGQELSIIGSDDPADEAGEEEGSAPARQDSSSIVVDDLYLPLAEPDPEPWMHEDHD